MAPFEDYYGGCEYDMNLEYDDVPTSDRLILQRLLRFGLTVVEICPTAQCNDVVSEK